MIKPVAKTLFNGIGALLALPLVVYARLGLTLFGSELPYSGAAQTAALVPGFLGRMVRRGFYAMTLERCAWDVDIHFGSIVTHPTTKIGPRVWIGLYSLIGRCVIEADVIIGSRVSILSGRGAHRFDDLDRPIAEQGGELAEIRIGRDSWFGEGATVMADVAPQCVVGSAAVVVKPTDAAEVVVGNPARPVGRRGADGPDGGNG